MREADTRASGPSKQDAARGVDCFVAVLWSAGCRGALVRFFFSEKAAERRKTAGGLAEGERGFSE